MDSLKKVLDSCLYWMTVVLFALLVVVVVWQVFSRQVWGDPATWTDEGARMAFVWLGLFASAFVFGERGHIAVEFLARKGRPGAKRGVAIGVQLVLMAFALVILTWGGLLAAQNAWSQELSALPFTYGHMYLAMPISGVLVVFYSVYYTRGLLVGSVIPYGDHTVEDDPEVQPEKYAPESVLLPEAEQPQGPLGRDAENTTRPGKDD